MRLLIPSQLKVGGFTYSVATVDSRDNQKGSDCYGKTNHESQEIFIDSGIAREGQEETFLHEILHTATNQAGFGEEIACTEEELVKRLSPVLYQIIRDNPIFTE